MVQNNGRPFPPDDDIFSKLTDKTIASDAADNLVGELSCALIDALYPQLDLFSRKCNSHIDPLHLHIRKRRTVTISEHTRLHLVWDSDVVYIKPLPSYLLSSDFWERHLPPGSPGRPHALGFVRTYAHLIRHRSDFHIAQKEDLIPPFETLHHSEFEKFIKNFRVVEDDQVSLRWEFGQIRLTRLNWAVRLLQPTTIEKRDGMFHRFFYEEQYQETRQYLYGLGPFLLFVFAALSLMLSAMQVVLAARGDNTWPAFAQASTGFSVAVIIVIATVFFVLFIFAVVVFILQLGFALRSRWTRLNSSL
ncbi:hypothetical protein F4679DRAFT_405239 [Xylaria curta]|nr:hypothetical protein F4679DRAFT_405239 [Xylaria curta]